MEHLNMEMHVKNFADQQNKNTVNKKTQSWTRTLYIWRKYRS